MAEEWRRQLARLRDVQPPSDLWRRIENPMPADRSEPKVRRSRLAYLTLPAMAVVLALLFKAFLGAPTTRQIPQGTESTLPSNGMIAFGSGREIYTVNSDGSSLKDLRKTPATDASGEVVEAPWAWSPDGTKLAYYGYVYDSDSQNPNYDIYVMNADGSNRVNLTQGTADRARSTDQSDPAWSPDGSRIAYVGLNGDGTYMAIYVTRVDGSETLRLATGGNPSWSPDGTKIAYEDAGSMYVVNSDGSNALPLTRGAGSNSEPSWSPDGKSIAFVSDRAGTPQVYTCTADGEKQARISSTTGAVSSPVWSPDGTQILFQSYKDGNWDIFVVHADGTGQTDLTPDANDEDSPVWSPDGTQIAFVSGLPHDPTDSTFDIYVMNADGSGKREITSGVPAGHHLAWQPIGASS